jgi:RNA polymerase sigma factor (sigma-70 family)
VEARAIFGDSELVRLRADFHERFEAFRPRLLAICRLTVGPADAEDVVQEAYLRASERLHQLRDPALLEAWLFRIALNQARSIRRAPSRRQLRLNDQEPAAGHEPPDLAVREAVDRLPVRQRAVVILHYVYGYKLAEVADLVGISEVNARTLLFRARRNLRTSLEKNDDQ